MKKILTLTLFTLLFMTATAQTLSLSGPTTVASGQDFVLAFQGESSSKFVFNLSIDYGGSNFPYYISLQGPTNVTFQNTTQGTRFTMKASFNTGGFTTPANITMKINYAYNGTSGSGTSSITKSISITPPPPPPAPVGPTSSQNQISFSSGVFAPSASRFSVSNYPLIQWLIAKGPITCYFYAEASNTSNFAVVNRSESIPSYTFTDGAFRSYGSSTTSPVFTQDTYIRMRFVYGGQNYYSNALFVPYADTTPPIVPGPTDTQSQLVLSAGSNISSFSVSNPAIAQFIQDNNIAAYQYTISYTYWENPSYADVIDINRTDITNTDFINANRPAFTQTAYVRMNFYYNNEYYFSNVLQIPL